MPISNKIYFSGESKLEKIAAVVLDIVLNQYLVLKNLKIYFILNSKNVSFLSNFAGVAIHNSLKHICDVTLEFKTHDTINQDICYFYIIALEE